MTPAERLILKVLLAEVMTPSGGGDAYRRTARRLDLPEERVMTAEAEHCGSIYSSPGRLQEATR